MSSLFTGNSRQRAEEREERKETGRVEAFSDGVFSIAITLLVLTIPVPHDASEVKIGTHVVSLAEYVSYYWPAFLAYAVSFLTILVMWLNHHSIFQLITRIDRTFLVLNGLLLLFVTFVNYPTVLLATAVRATPDDLRFAAAFYSLTMVAVAVFYWLMWRHAVAEDRLVASSADRAVIETINHQYRFSGLPYLVAFALALANGWASIAANAALAVYFAFTAHVARSERERTPDPIFSQEEQA